MRPPLSRAPYVPKRRRRKNVASRSKDMPSTPRRSPPGGLPQRAPVVTSAGEIPHYQKHFRPACSASPKAGDWDAVAAITRVKGSNSYSKMVVARLPPGFAGRARPLRRAAP